MAIQEYVGAVVLEVDGKEIEYEKLNVSDLTFAYDKGYELGKANAEKIAQLIGE